MCGFFQINIKQRSVSLFSLCVLVYLCVCVCVCVCFLMYLCTCIGYKSMLGVFLSFLLHYFLKQGLADWLANKPHESSCLSPCSCGYRRTLPFLGFTWLPCIQFSSSGPQDVMERSYSNYPQFIPAFILHELVMRTTSPQTRCCFTQSEKVSI